MQVSEITPKKDKMVTKPTREIGTLTEMTVEIKDGEAFLNS